MLVKCTSEKLNHIHFVTSSDGTRRPMKIKVGDTFEVKGIPPQWRGLVVAVDGPVAGEKVAITNPAQPEDLAELKAAYRAKTGNHAHYTWDAEKIRAKLAEASE